MSWYNTLGEHGDIVLSTRVRLARNLEDFPFPVRLDRDGKKQVSECVKNALSDYTETKLNFIDMEELSRNDAVSLAEKHLISPEFAYDSTGRALLQSDDEEVSIMLCEEDHIRIQVILPGLSQQEAYLKAEKIDKAIEEKLGYAFNDKLGYLTQCPTNLGTGMRASVMLHLPALVRKGAMRRLSSTVAKLGLTLRGAYSEGVEAAGDIFQLSNQVTLGISEEAALRNLGSIAMQIITEEKQARASIVNDSEFIDRIYRANGILRSAYKLSSKELVGLTSLVLLGAEEKIIDAPMEKLASMNILLMPATLRMTEGENLSRDERDILRAKKIREVLG
ncbi:MAG: protein arginine kinase [Clostridia bacterium]|nr:protein arginine kinase [Clostridia bacterium]